VFDLKEIFTASLVLLAVINILGSVPLIISLREKVGHIESEKASIIAAIIMISFLFLGDEILKLIGIDVNSFAVAGSLILLFLALEMILGVTIFRNEAPETASIVPIAFPMIAGAGTMTSLLSLRAEFDVANIIIAILINIIFVYIILKSSKMIKGWLGKSGINIIQKVFGIILLAIAVKLFTSNIGQLL
jgi:multiple antibiotic resistance protein|tara:strand:+ start:7859 stop:8428 length:570 start_codon:yes stop_codon:yes gene_type:complete